MSCSSRVNNNLVQISIGKIGTGILSADVQNLGLVLNARIYAREGTIKVDMFSLASGSSIYGKRDLQKVEFNIINSGINKKYTLLAMKLYISGNRQYTFLFKKLYEKDNEYIRTPENEDVTLIMDFGWNIPEIANTITVNTLYKQTFNENILRDQQRKEGIESGNQIGISTFVTIQRCLSEHNAKVVFLSNGTFEIRVPELVGEKTVFVGDYRQHESAPPEGNGQQSVRTDLPVPTSYRIPSPVPCKRKNPTFLDLTGDEVVEIPHREHNDRSEHIEHSERHEEVERRETAMELEDIQGIETPENEERLDQYNYPENNETMNI